MTDHASGDALPDAGAGVPPATTPDEGVTGGRLLTTDLALIATGAALVAVCSLLAVPVGPAGAPITLQTFAVLLVGAVLGSRRGALAVLLYLAVGLAGLPIFAEGTGGLATFGKITLGYLLAFPVAAWLTGAIVERGDRHGWAARSSLVLVAGLLGMLVVYAAGVPVLSARIGVTLAEGLAINALFIPLDSVKLVLAAVVATAVHRAYPELIRG